MVIEYGSLGGARLASDIIDGGQGLRRYGCGVRLNGVLLFGRQGIGFGQYLLQPNHSVRQLLFIIDYPNGFQMWQRGVAFCIKAVGQNLQMLLLL